MADLMPKVQLYEARICHVAKRDDFDGYGFNLHAEKGRPGQYIGKVDEGSPAESAGLRQGDRIIDVNGINIGSETHKQVVERIKSVQNQTRLLVIDPRADIHDHQQLIQIEKIVASNLNNNNNNNNKTNTIKNNINNNNTNGTNVTSSDMKIEMNSSSKDVVSSITTTTTTTTTTTNGTTSPQNSNNNMNHNNNNNNNNNMSKPALASLDEKTTTTPTSMDDSIKSTNSNGTSTPGILNLHMTAAEMRAQLKSKKRIDPKMDSLDVRKKYEAIQKL